MMRRLFALALVAVCATACGKKVVELELPDAAAPQACSESVREDGIICKLCRDASGAITSVDCPNQIPPSATADAAPMPALCKVWPTGLDRCLSCGSSTMACLKCDGFVNGNSSCRTCLWSDDGSKRCQQCLGPNGGVVLDECDKLRPETLLYPEGADGGA